VVELTRLGDVLCTLPALSRMRGAHPQAQITCVIQEPYAQLVQALNLDLRTIGLARTETLTGLFRGLREVRRVNADLVCSMSPAKRNAILALGSKAPRKAGYLRYLNARIQYLHNSPVHVIGAKPAARVSYGREHLSLRAMKVCDALGIPESAALPTPAIRREKLDEAALKIAPFLQSVRGSYVVLHPFAGWNYKQWPVENFIGLASRIIDEIHESVVVICEEQERSRWEAALKGRSNIGGLHLFSSTSLLETSALVQGASVMVGNDSGPLHLAALLEVPLVGLFGPSTPELTAPHTSRGVFLYHPVHCSPCPQKTCIHPLTPCMPAISMDEVIGVIRSLRIFRSQRYASTYA
jgi:ADP-heptose:LPS heptosyltransferase